MFGFLGMAGKASAQNEVPCTSLNPENNTNLPANCTVVSGNGLCIIVPTSGPRNEIKTDFLRCKDTAIRIDGGYKSVSWTPGSSSEEVNAAQNTGVKTPFEDAVDDQSCFTLTVNMGCIVKLLYYIFYLPSTFLLWLSAQFFNALISISLNGDLLSQTFVNSAWGVVRDLSNIFFIIILLYAAFEMILGMSHDVKKTLANIIIVALLINFSMFFTKVVIDTSNVLALVFYNKLSVTGKDGKPIGGTPATGPKEKNISGALYYSFNPTKLLTPEFFEATKKNDTGIPGSGEKAKSNKVAPGILLGIIIISVAIMSFAAYCFFASGIFFLGRLIELFILVIFSPFAFISFAIPQLKKRDYIGWDSWTTRLTTVSFMAPIFMFFMYFIFMLLKADLFSALIPGKDLVQTILGVVLPALLILILLLKATDFAKKGSGSFGDALMKGAKVVGGLALGAVTMGAGVAAGATASMGTEMLGGLAAKKLKESGEDWKTKANEGGLGGYAARMKLRTMEYGSKASFDIRQAPGVGKLAGKAGLNLETAKIIGFGSKEGGYEGSVKRRAEKNKEEFNKVKTKMTDKEVQEWSTKKIEEYETTKKEARTKDRRYQGLDDKEFERKYKADVGLAPAPVNSAAELNDLRLKQFTASLGKTGLLASAAQSLVKNTTGFATEDSYLEDKEYTRRHQEKYGERAPINFREDLAKEINDARIKMAKLAIGGAFAIGTGGLGGAAIGTVIGAGAVVGGVAGAGAVATVGGGKVMGDVASQNVTTKMGLKGSVKAGDEKFLKDMTKELKDSREKMTSVTSRIERNKKEIGKLEELLTEQFKDDAKKPEEERIVVKNENGDIEIQEEKLTQAIINETLKQKQLQSSLEKLQAKMGNVTEGVFAEEERKEIQASINKDLKDMSVSVVQMDKLNKLKTAPEKIEGLKQNQDKLEDRKHTLEEKEKEANKPKDKPKSASSTTKAPSAPKHEETHGGGESHDAGGHDAHAAPAGGHH